MCRPDRVEIDMTPFMQKYRPDEFDSWYDYWYGERALPVKSMHHTIRMFNILFQKQVVKVKKAQKSLIPLQSSYSMYFHGKGIWRRQRRKFVISGHIVH
jgi:hypothetical protein